MPRQRSPNRDKAFKIYKKHNGNIENRQIAKILDISEKTVSGWKCKDHWQDKLNGVLQKNTEYSERKKNRINKEPELEEVTEILNSELTDKQRLFCIYYPKCFNATKAAKKAGYSEDTAYSIGWELLKKPEIKAEIQKLKQNKFNRAMLDPDDIFQRYLDIAFACITDYVSFGQRPYKVKDKKGKERTIMYNYIDLNNSNEVDGSLISEVKQGKDGVSIKLHDAMKALDWLSKHMDIATEEQKLKCEKLKAEVNNIKGDSKHDEAKTWADKIEEIAAKRRGKDG